MCVYLYVHVSMYMLTCVLYMKVFKNKYLHEYAKVIVHFFVKDMHRDPGSNWGPSGLQYDALPTELSRHLLLVKYCCVFWSCSWYAQQLFVRCAPDSIQPKAPQVHMRIRERMHIHIHVHTSNLA